MRVKEVLTPHWGFPQVSGEIEKSAGTGALLASFPKLPTGVAALSHVVGSHIFFPRNVECLDS